MEKNKLKVSCLCPLFIYAISFLFMFGAGLKCDAKTAGYLHKDGSYSDSSYNGNIANIYKCIFGSDSVGKYGLEEMTSSALLMVGFFLIIVTIVIIIIDSILMYKEQVNLGVKITSVVSSLGVCIFLNPAIFGNHVMEAYSEFSYSSDYKNVRLGGMAIFLFIVYLMLFVWILINTILCMRRKDA